MKKDAKKFSYPEFFTIFAVPKLRPKSANQLSLKELGKRIIFLK